MPASLSDAYFTSGEDAGTALRTACLRASSRMSGDKSWRLRAAAPSGAWFKSFWRGVLDDCEPMHPAHKLRRNPCRSGGGGRYEDEDLSGTHAQLALVGSLNTKL